MAKKLIGGGSCLKVKNQNIKQKQYCDRFKKGFKKIVPIKKEILKNIVWKEEEGARKEEGKDNWH